MPEAATGPRVGTVALVGRPNAGKSTLMNRLLAAKVAIVSDKPQTTRHRIVGILSEERGQIVFFDTPGIHKPMHRMNRRMVEEAEHALASADVACLLVDASRPFGGGDEHLLEVVGRVDVPRVLVLNKVDLVRKERLLPLLERYGATGLFAELVPISAATGDGAELLLRLLFERLPEGPPLYDPDLLTLHPERFLAAETVREKVLELTREELPFSTAVLVERWEEDPETGLVRIWASIIVERDGQKAIVVGRGGAMIREIGTAARLDLEEQLERKVFLQLHVRVEPGWRESERMLAELEREVWAGLGAGRSAAATGPATGEDELDESDPGGG